MELVGITRAQQARNTAAFKVMMRMACKAAESRGRRETGKRVPALVWE